MTFLLLTSTKTKPTNFLNSSQLIKGYVTLWAGISKQSTSNCNFNVRRMTNKTQFNIVDEYIGASPENIQSEKIGQIMRKATPEAVEAIC